MTIAVIKTGGKQYKVSSGQKLKVEKLDAKEGEAVVFNDVLLAFAGGKIEIGAPYVGGAKVSASVVKNGREKKKIVFHYHNKTRYRKKKGHRQPYTQIEVKEIKF